MWPIQHGYEIFLRYNLETGLRVVWIYAENVLTKIIILIDFETQFTDVCGVHAKGVQWVR